MKKFLGANAFVLNMLLILAVSALLPTLGSSESPLPIGLLKQMGIFLIFFNQGVLLPGEALRKGFLELKLHALVQLTTFVFFPLVVGVLLWASSGFFTQPDLRAGFLFLAFLPSTISSAVALTSVAEGNVSGALFNCTLSVLIGVFLVPVLCLFFLGQGGDGTQMEAGSILRDISITLLLPLAVGQAVRPLLHPLFAAHKRGIRHFNNGVILFIIWTAFCESFLRNVWSRISGTQLGLSVLLCLVILFLSSGWMWWMSARLKLPGASRITALFCGSQKSIGMGLPLSAMIFSGAAAGRIELSLLVIPVLIYHPTQLIFAGWLVPRLSNPEVGRSNPV